MAAILYPDTLPSPDALPLVLQETRSLVPDAPFEVRARSLDLGGGDSATEWTVTDAEADIWWAWWRDLLAYGGAWFGAAWPHPDGAALHHYRFASEPTQKHMGGGVRKISAQLTVRAASAAPTAPPPAPAPASGFRLVQGATNSVNGNITPVTLEWPTIPAGAVSAVFTVTSTHAFGVYLSQGGSFNGMGGTTNLQPGASTVFGLPYGDLGPLHGTLQFYAAGNAPIGPAYTDGP